MSYQGPSFNHISELPPIEQMDYRTFFLRQSNETIAAEATIEELIERRKVCTVLLEMISNDRSRFLPEDLHNTRTMYRFWDRAIIGRAKQLRQQELLDDSVITYSVIRLPTRVVDMTQRCPQLHIQARPKRATFTLPTRNEPVQDSRAW